jgi:hypothetical protein
MTFVDEVDYYLYYCEKYLKDIPITSDDKDAIDADALN